MSMYFTIRMRVSKKHEAQEHKWEGSCNKAALNEWAEVSYNVTRETIP